MAKVKLALEEGFEDDHVVVATGGRTIADETGVTTRYQINLARLLELDLPDGASSIEVSVPEKGLTGTLNFDGQAPETMKASVARDGSGIVFVRDEPLRFM